MTLRSLIRKWFFERRRSKTPMQKRRPSVRLLLEPLETRLVPTALTLLPSYGPQGSSFTESVSGFLPAERVDFYFNGRDDGTATTDSSGSATVNNAQVPATLAGGNWTVAAQGASGDSALANFTVTPNLILGPTSGIAGSSFTESATGFAAGETVDFFFNGFFVDSATADGAGDCSATDIVPAVTPGSYSVVAFGLASSLSSAATFTVTPTLSATPTLTLSPMSGPSGSSVTESATGFLPGETVGFSFLGGADANGVPLVSAVADSSGDCTATLTVPAVTAGFYNIGAYGETSGQGASAQFVATPTLTLSPSSGPSGSSFTVSAIGFTEYEVVSFSIDGNAIGSGITDANGDCSAAVTVPSWLAPGSHTVSAYGETSQFSAGATYVVTAPALALSPSSGPFSLSPSSGLPGESFSVALSSFGPNESVELYFDGIDDHAGATTDASGSAAISGAQVPTNLPGGSYTVEAVGSFGDQATANFTITPSVLLYNGPEAQPVSSGPPGYEFNLSVLGFIPNENVTLSLGGITLGGSCQTDTRGIGQGTFQVPGILAFAPGNYTLTATGEFGDSASTPFKVTPLPTLALSPSSGPFSLSPSSGQLGESFSVALSNFAPHESVELYFAGGDDNAGATTDATGSAAIIGAQVPTNLPGGSYTVEAIGSFGDTATANFTITPALFLSSLDGQPVSSGPPGSVFSLGLAGFLPGENVTVSLGGIPLAAGDVTSAEGGSSMAFQVPGILAFAPGPYTVTATGANGDSASTPFKVTPLPTLTLSPSSGPFTASPGSGLLGESFSVALSNFAPNESVELYFNGSDDHAGTTTDATGSAAISGAQVPYYLPGGSYSVEAVGSSGDTATANFTITPSFFQVLPPSGPPGSSFAVGLAGFYPNENVTFSLDGIPLAGNWVTNVQGDSIENLQVPGSLAPGNDTVTATGANGDSASAPFEVTPLDAPTLTLSPTFGPQGSSFTGSVTGFLPGETVNFSFDGVFAGSGTANSAGDCSPLATVPAVPRGNYQVTATGATSGDSASATFQVTPTLTLSPSSGPFTLSPSSGLLGESFSVALSNFAPHESVELYFDGSDDNIGATTDASGSAAIIGAQVPYYLPGASYPVEAIGSFGDEALANFTITPSIWSLLPQSGPPGSSFAVGLAGFYPNENVTLSLGGIPLAGNWVTNVQGDSFENLQVPGSLAPGNYTLTATGQYGDSASDPFEVTPLQTLTLSRPSSGPQGSSFTGSVTGFLPGETVIFSFNGVFDGGAIADSSGDCNATLTVPAVPGGSYQVTAMGVTSGDSASAPFIVTPALTLSPSSSPQGSSFTGSVTGFLPGETVIFSFNGVFDGGGIADSSGDCNAALTVPAVPGDSYQVTATGVTSGDSASAPFIVTPALTLSPSSGPQGSSFTESATGFLPGETVIITFNGLFDGGGTANSAGDCSALATVPALPGGSYSVIATGTSGDSASATFVVTPALTLIPSSGQTGSSFTESVTGFLPGETVICTFNGVFDGGGTANSAGDCSALATVPAVPGGSYQVIATGTTSGDRASASYVVTAPALTLSPSGGPQGSSFTESVTGFLPGETVNFSFNGVSDGSGTANSAGDCSALATVPAVPGGSYQVIATGTSGDSASASFNCLSVTNPGTLANAVGDTVARSIQTSGLPSGDSFAFGATGLPSGLAISSTSGAISGTITGTANAYSVTVTASDGNGASASASFSWNVSVLSVTNPGTQNSAAGGTPSPLLITAGGLPSSDSFTFGAVGLPSGLTISSTSGAISGTITAAANAYSVRVTASDGQGASASAGFTWNVSLSITNSGNQNNAHGDMVTLPIQANGLQNGATWKYAATGLPAGLAISPTTGVISGTVTGAAKAYSVTVTPTDSKGGNASASFTWNVSVLSLTNPGTLSNAVGDTLALTTISASGVPAGDNPTYSATGLPSGLSINSSTGAISGTMSGAAGTYSAKVTASDGHGGSASQSFSWKVSVLSLTNPGTQNNADGDTVSLSKMTASGVPSGANATYAASGLPAGLSIDSTSGVISGTVSGAASAYSVRVTLSDGNGGSTSQGFTWNVSTLSVTNPGTQNSAVGDTVSLSTVSTNGLPSGDTLTYSASGLPANLSINKTTGVISGKVTGPAQAYSVTVTASDGHGGSASQTFTWNVSVLSLSNPGGQNNAVGDSVSLSAIESTGVPTGATPTYTTSGLPSGLSINASTGVISGTVTGAAKTYSVTVSVSDGHGGSTSQSFSWKITTLSVTNPGTQNAAVGATLTLAIIANGLPAGDSWSFSDTGLPPGLMINPTTGVISGTITGPITTYSVTITARDGDGASVSATFKFKVT